MESDYSIFDFAVAPVLIVSDDFRIIYANQYAKRSFSFLATPSGLTLRFSEETLKSTLDILRKGRPHTLRYNEDACLFLLLKPEMTQENGLKCIYVYVVCIDRDPLDMFPYMTDGELLSRMQREVYEPMNTMLRQLKTVEQYLSGGDIKKSLIGLQIIEQGMLRSTLFFSRLSDATPKRDNSCVLSDAVHALRACNRQFSSMKYKATDPCYIPMERDSQLLLYVDLLTNLICRQDKPSVSVTSKATDEGVVIDFASGPLNKFLDEPCEGDFDGIDTGLFSVRRRAEAVGGEVSIKKRNNGGVIVTLKFPKVNLLFAETTFHDPGEEEISDKEFFALKYFQSITKKYCI